MIYIWIGLAWQVFFSMIPKECEFMSVDWFFTCLFVELERKASAVQMSMVCARLAEERLPMFSAVQPLVLFPAPELEIAAGSMFLGCPFRQRREEAFQIWKRSHLL
mmetsp:Transcript_26175/g.102557  ORF Transcript_26175/g.102557 Transcript_26175/m.102557 type:complete len:106 (-) Transcript_26175:1785-2102(-)